MVTHDIIDYEDLCGDPAVIANVFSNIRRLYAGMVTDGVCALMASRPYVAVRYLGRLRVRHTLLRPRYRSPCLAVSARSDDAACLPLQPTISSSGMWSQLTMGREEYQWHEVETQSSRARYCPQR